MFIPNHVTDDFNILPDTNILPDYTHRRMTPLKRSLDSSSELLEGTSESHMGDVSQDPVMPPVQRRKLDPLPQKHRHLKIAKTKIMRKKKKEKVNPHHSTIFPTSLVPLQSEEGEVVDTKPILLSAQENDPDLLSEVEMRHEKAKFWACHISIGKIMITLHLEWVELRILSLRNILGSLGPDRIWKNWLRGSSHFSICALSLRVFNFIFLFAGQITESAE